MGNFLRRICKICSQNKLTKKNIVLLMLGLDNAGKTSALNFIANDIDKKVMSTMGFRLVLIKHKFYSIKVYDIGGAYQIRPIWKKYYNDIHGVIYVVDASDVSRLNENRILFNELTSHEHIAGKPILLLANKQDIPGAIDELDLVENLDVEKAVNLMRCPTRVETCACVFDEKSCKQNTQGIIDGYKWLLETIIKNYLTLDEKINASQINISSINNHSLNRSLRSSVSSITSSQIFTYSNPFKPICELVSITRRNSAVKSSHHKESLVKNIMVKNKTAPISKSLTGTQKVEYFNENDNNDEIALDPLDLISKSINRPMQTRPFTAPPTSRNLNTSMVINIPGQVPS